MSAALALFLTLPVLALFYGGLARTKNVLLSMVYSGILTFMTLKLVGNWFRAGATPTETEGLDLLLHHERGYNL